MIEFSMITDAAHSLKGQIRSTPLLSSPTLDSRLGFKLLVKPEMLQYGGAFKFRGASYKLHRLGSAARRGIVAFSSGNHAQAVALLARERGIQAHIVMPADAPAIKLHNTRILGADVITYDRVSESREAIAEAICRTKNLEIIPPFDDPEIIAGQGTVGLEIALECKAMGVVPQAITVPVSGGGLAAGVCIGVHQFFPKAEILAVEPAGHDDLAHSLARGKLCKTPTQPQKASICDALLAPQPGRHPFKILQHHLAGALALDDADVLQAMRVIMQEFRLIAEPGGALALAAILEGALAFKPQTSHSVAIAILSGGNADPKLIAQSCMP
ncbi:MAG: threonine/serine dehydratase [Pseudomonadota bacterium]